MRVCVGGGGWGADVCLLEHSEKRAEACTIMYVSACLRA